MKGNKENYIISHANSAEKLFPRARNLSPRAEKTPESGLNKPLPGLFVSKKRPFWGVSEPKKTLGDKSTGKKPPTNYARGPK